MNFDLAGKLENILAFFGKRVDAFSQKKSYVDLIAASTAGLFIGALIFLIDGADGDRDWKRCVNAALVAVLSYLSVMLLLQMFWRGTLKRILPHWLMASALGSFLFIAIGAATSMNMTLELWKYYQDRMTLSEFILRELEMARVGFLLLVILTLPITALIHYAGAIVRFIDRWHSGSEQAMSIIRK